MRIYLAPMEGVIDHHLRLLLTKIGGIDACTTEFVRVNDHLLPPKVFLRYCPELTQYTSQKKCENPLPCPIRLQLLGSNPETLASNAARAAQLGAAGIDLNFGCPAKTVNKHRGGACMLDHTAQIGDIVKEVRSAVPAHIPVSVKIRLGYNQRDSGLRNALAIEQAGANELAVHARSKADAYKPPAYWNEIAEIKSALSIPVIANGEIWTLEDFKRCREQSGCEHIMLGRGILATPDLALQIKASQQQTFYTPIAWSEVTSLLLEFFLLTQNQYQKSLWAIESSNGCTI